jgi:hypothetical protein
MDLTDINSRTIPSQLRYSDLTPLGLSSKSKKMKFLPQNAGTFTNNSNIIRIPISSASAFLDPAFTSLKFDYTNTSGQTVQFDGSANSVIQRMRLVSASGGDLEDIRHYGYLVNVLSDLQYSLHQRFTKSYEGYGYSGITRGAVVAQVGGATLYAEGAAGQLAYTVVAQPVLAAVSETSIGTGELSLANGASATIMLPILSSLIGSQAKKYLPLFLTGQIMLELELANNYAPFVSAVAVTNFSISSVELHCQLVEFDADVNQNLISMSLKNGLYLHGTSWASYTSALNGANPSIVISERLKSVKSIFTCFSPAPADSTERYMARSAAGVTELSFRIGSEIYPNQPIRGTAADSTKNCEFILETLKAIGEYNSLGHQSLINPVNFASSAVSLVSVGRAVFGIDLDAFSKSPIESGVNTVLNNPVTISASSANFAGNNFTFMLHDILFFISPDGHFTASK